MKRKDKMDKKREIIRNEDRKRTDEKGKGKKEQEKRKKPN